MCVVRVCAVPLGARVLGRGGKGTRRNINSTVPRLARLYTAFPYGDAREGRPRGSLVEWRTVSGSLFLLFLRVGFDREFEDSAAGRTHARTSYMISHHFRRPAFILFSLSIRRIFPVNDDGVVHVCPLERKRKQ
ncbi:unnamed protein product [Ectocarpus sp. 8 AP-2014]